MSLLTQLEHSKNSGDHGMNVLHDVAVVNPCNRPSPICGDQRHHNKRVTEADNLSGARAQPQFSPSSREIAPDVVTPGR